MSRNNVTNFPNLRKVAAWLLAIPDSSAIDERVFSATGTTMSPLRTHLGGSALGNLAYIHENY